MLDLQPLLREFFQRYRLEVATSENRDVVAERCKNLVVEEAQEFEEALNAFRRRRTRNNRVHFAGEAADVRYVIAYTGYALDFPIRPDAPGYGATFESRLTSTTTAFDELMATSPGSAEEESWRIMLAMQLSHMDVMAHRAAQTEGTFDLDEVVTEVHAANMRKIWPDGTIHYREDGKVLKPPTWTPADIAGILYAPVDTDSAAA